MKTYNWNGVVRCVSSAFLFHMFSRMNPVLPPRRKRATAATHARVVAEVLVWLDSVQTSVEVAQKWAAITLLEAGSRIVPPQGYHSIAAGSLRRYARDQGGVEGTTLLTLAKWILQDDPGPDAMTLKAWKLLYPNTSALDMGGTAWNADCRDAVFTERVEKALEEWELMEDPEAIFWWQFDCPPEDANNLWELFGVGTMPEPEDSCEYIYQGLLITAFRGGAGDLSLQFDCGDVDSRATFSYMLDRCETTWTLQVNRTAWLEGTGARQFMGTVEEFQVQ